MTLLATIISDHADANALAPAIIGFQKSVSYRDTISGIKSIVQFFHNSRFPQKSRVFVDISDPFYSIVVKIAALQFGFILIDAPSEIIKNFNKIVDCVICVNEHDTEINANHVIIPHKVIDNHSSDFMILENHNWSNEGEFLIHSNYYAKTKRSLYALTVKCFMSRLNNNFRYSIGDRVMFLFGRQVHLNIGFIWNVLAGMGCVFLSCENALGDLQTINNFCVSHLFTNVDELNKLMQWMEYHSILAPSVKEIHIVQGIMDSQFVKRVESIFESNILISFSLPEFGVISKGAVDSNMYVAGYAGKLLDCVRLLRDTQSRFEFGTLNICENDMFAEIYSKNRGFNRRYGSVHRFPFQGFVLDGGVYLGRANGNSINIGNLVISRKVIEATCKRLGRIDDIECSALSSGDGRHRVVVIVVCAQEMDVGVLCDLIHNEVFDGSREIEVCCRRVDLIPRLEAGGVDLTWLNGLLGVDEGS